jgi:CHASE3 domain sensor protein
VGYLGSSERKQMTHSQREYLLNLNEQLCREYSESDDDDLLEDIAFTELLLLNDPDREIAEAEFERLYD